MTTTARMMYPSPRPLFSDFEYSDLPPPKPVNLKPDPSIPVVALPLIPQELSGSQKQALLYGYTLDDTTAKKLGLPTSYEVADIFFDRLYLLNLQGYVKVYFAGLRDDLQLFYFAIKLPHHEIWTPNNKGTIPSGELMDQLSQTIKMEPRWYGYDDLTSGPLRATPFWDACNPFHKPDH